jgi:hypothetical protein
LFEARTILEDLAVIARLKRLGVRGDSVFHRGDAETSKREIEGVTSGGAIRLCALDSLKAPPASNRLVRDHFRDLDQLRGNIDLVLRDRGELLERLGKLLPDVVDGLEAVKAFPILNAITAEDINEIVMKHRGLTADYGALADAIRAEADGLGARHTSLPLLFNLVLAIQRLLDQHVLFGPKPLHGERAYEEWVESVRLSSKRVEDARQHLERLSAAHVWAAG